MRIQAAFAAHVGPAVSQNRPTRRSFLLGTLGSWVATTLGGLFAGVYGCSRPAPDRRNQPSAFSENEIETLQALFDTMLPGDGLPSASEAGLVARLVNEFQRAGPAEVEEWKTLCRRLSEHERAGPNDVGVSFGDLSQPEREALAVELVEPTVRDSVILLYYELPQI